MKEAVLGIDCSTTMAKAIIWDKNGRALAEGRSPLDMIVPEPGRAEQDPEQWWAAAIKAIRQGLRIAKGIHIKAHIYTARRQRPELSSVFPFFHRISDTITVTHLCGAEQMFQNLAE